MRGMTQASGNRSTSGRGTLAGDQDESSGPESACLCSPGIRITCLPLMVSKRAIKVIIREEYRYQEADYDDQNASLALTQLTESRAR